MASIKENLGTGYNVVMKEIKNLKPLRNLLLGGAIILALIIFEVFFLMPLGIKLDKVPMGNIKFTVSGLIIAYVVSCLIYYGYIYTKPHPEYDVVDKFYYGWMYGIMLWGIMGLGGVFYNDFASNILHVGAWTNAALSIILCVTWGLVAAFVYDQLEHGGDKNKK